MHGSIGRSMEPGTMSIRPTRQSRVCLSLCLPLVVNEGPFPTGRVGRYCFLRVSDSLIPLVVSVQAFCVADKLPAIHTRSRFRPSKSPFRVATRVGKYR